MFKDRVLKLFSLIKNILICYFLLIHQLFKSMVYHAKLNLPEDFVFKMVTLI